MAEDTESCNFRAYQKCKNRFEELKYELNVTYQGDMYMAPHHIRQKTEEIIKYFEVRNEKCKCTICSSAIGETLNSVRNGFTYNKSSFDNFFKIYLLNYFLSKYIILI